MHHAKQPFVSVAEYNQSKETGERGRRRGRKIVRGKSVKCGKREKNLRVRQKNEIAQSESWMLHNRHGNNEECLGFQSCCVNRDVDGPLYRPW